MPHIKSTAGIANTPNINNTTPKPTPVLSSSIQNTSPVLWLMMISTFLPIDAWVCVLLAVLLLMVRFTPPYSYSYK